MKEQIISILSKAKNTVSKHSPEILTTLGIGGMGVSLYLTAKATPKAIKLVKDFEEATGKKANRKEKIRVAWKPYIYAGGTFLASSACLIASNSISGTKSAMLMSALNLAERAQIQGEHKLKEYNKEVEKRYGKEEAENIGQAVNESIYRDYSTAYNTGNGHILCCCSLTGQLFWSDPVNIEKAINNINKSAMFDDGFRSINDLYDEYGLEHPLIGGDLQWNTAECPVAIMCEPSETLLNDRIPYVIIRYNYKPMDISRYK